MRVVLFAWCATVRFYLDALVDGDAPPALVLSGTEAPASQTLEAACAAHAVLLERPDERAPGFVARLAALQPDLILVAGWPRKLRGEITRLAGSGAVNFHPSLLPRHRGRDPLFWSILAGEHEVGVTVHHLTGELDAGPILWQTRVRVPEGATHASLAELCDRAGSRLVPTLLEAARQGRLPPGRPQPANVLPDPAVTEEHTRLDFGRDARVLDRLVRACDGVRPAHTFFQGMKLVALSAEPLQLGHAAPPGTVLAIEPSGLSLATAKASDGSDTLRVSRWLFVAREHSASELATRLGIRPGTRL